ncbi:hypothetical protein GCM10027395_30920 [Giesbergeria sinuosa]
MKTESMALVVSSTIAEIQRLEREYFELSDQKVESRHKHLQGESLPLPKPLRDQRDLDV